MRTILLILALSLAVVDALASTTDSLRFSQRMSIMFYNCENLFWPTDDTLKNDDEFTPQGSRHWTFQKLNQKLVNLSRVLLSAGQGRFPAVVGLCEVENDSVLLRLTRSTALYKVGYRYLITQSPDARGINVALLYRNDDFRLLGWHPIRIPVRPGIRPTRDMLHAFGRIVGGDTLDVIVCHLPSRLGGTRQSRPRRQEAHRILRHYVDSLSSVRQHANVLVMGDMNDPADARSLQRDMSFGRGLTNMMTPLQRSLKRHRLLYGSHKYQGEWSFLDQFWVSDALLSSQLPQVGTKTTLTVSNPHVVAFPFMLAEDATHLGQRPLRSFYGFQYEGGFSDHLPVMIDLESRY